MFEQVLKFLQYDLLNLFNPNCTCHSCFVYIDTNLSDNSDECIEHEYPERAVISDGSKNCIKECECLDGCAATRRRNRSKEDAISTTATCSSAHDERSNSDSDSDCVIVDSDSDCEIVDSDSGEQITETEDNDDEDEKCVIDVKDVLKPDIDNFCPRPKKCKLHTYTYLAQAPEIGQGLGRFLSCGARKPEQT